MRILEDFFKKLLNKFTAGIMKSVESNFREGSIRILSMAGRNDLKPIPPTKQEKELLNNQIYDNIKGVTDDLNKQIRNEISNSILAHEDTKQLTQRLDGIFKGTNPTKINYKARLKMIAVTEKARVQNTSSMKTGKKYFTHKYLEIINDKKTSEQSKEFYKKYGGENKAIPIDEEFTITYKGKVYSGQFPPFMPNDRDLIYFTNKEKEE